MQLRISDDQQLPLDFVTQATAILARRGGGKTYTAAVMAEEVIGAGQPIVIVDPLGVFWGLRSSADGKSEGLSVIILGGRHGDVPLEPTAGELVAHLVVDRPGAYILDLSSFESDAAQDRFMASFLDTLYRAKAEQNSALLVVVDEADCFAPQRPGPAQLKMLGAMEAIVRRGRVRGLGMVMITQRPAVLNKNVLTQCELLVLLQTTSPQDRDAIDAWIEGHGSKEQRTAVMGSLASLERGQAWIWSPAWLQVLKRIQIRRRTTFDSSATPKAGETVKAPKRLAPVDLDKLGAEIKATQERAKENDPRELKARISKLQGQVAQLESAAKIQKEIVRTVEIPVIDPSVVKTMADLVIGIQSLSRAFGDIQERVRGFKGAPALPRASQPPQPVSPAAKPVVAAVRAAGGGETGLGRCERAILTVLSQFGTSPKAKVAAVAGYSITSSSFSNALGALRSAGYIDRNEPISINEPGRRALGDFCPMPVGEELRQYWLSKVGKCEREILKALFAAPRSGLEKSELAAAAGYSETSSSFTNALGALRTLELINRGQPIQVSAYLCE